MSRRDDGDAGEFTVEESGEGAVDFSLRKSIGDDGLCERRDVLSGGSSGGGAGVTDFLVRSPGSLGRLRRRGGRGQDKNGVRQRGNRYYSRRRWFEGPRGRRRRYLGVVDVGISTVKTAIWMVLGLLRATKR